MKEDIGLLFLRLYGGLFMLLAHGWPKLLKLVGEAPIQFVDIAGIGMTASLTLAVFAEVFCALLIILGVATRWASIPLAVTLGVAAFWVHGADPWSRKELAISYFCVYVALFCFGGGRLGFDRFIKRASN